MVIKLETKEGYEQATLKFKALVEGEYLIVSKVFDEPLSGPSQFCKNTEGRWYKFALNLDEYTAIDMVAMKKDIVTDAGEVGYFDGDNEYDKNEKKPELGEKWIQSQGTILKALNKAEVGERLKITMVENAKGKMVYNVESLDSVVPSASTPAPVAAVPAPAAEPVATGTNPAVKTMIDGLKMASLPVDTVITTVQGKFPEVTAEEITSLFVGGQN